MANTIAGSMNDTMERPSKRPRLSLTPDPLEEDNMEEQQGKEDIPEEWDLQAARAQNDMRLKSIFEGIFSKYGKDFTDVGDEIDLQTGKIVVDNGHLTGMRKEDDAGDAAGQAWFHEAALSEDDADHEYGGDEDQDMAVMRSLPEHSLDTPANDETARSPVNNALVDYNADSQKDDGKPVIKSHPAPELDLFDKDTGPTDPIWKAPELPALFSTPKTETKRKGAPPKLPNLTRKASPPGSGSLWSVPRMRRPRTEAKPRATPSKRRPRAKRKYHSSPMIHDWSFAATPDGDESDDPLQEFAPSPSPSLLKRKAVTKAKDERSIQPSACTDSPLSRQLFPDTQLPQHQSATRAEVYPIEIQAQEDSTSHVEFEDNSNLQENDSYATPQSHMVGSTPSETTPIKSPRGLTPDEAKLIVCMRHLQKKKWQEIHENLPARTRSSIYQWNTHHWADRRECPPPLSAPWSQSESEALGRLKDETGLSWPDIKKEIPNRTQAEIEFELLRLWVGDEVWFGEGYRAYEQAVQQDGESDEEQQEAVLEEVDAPAEPISPKFLEEKEPFIVTGKKRFQIFEDIMDDDDDDDDPLASSPSKLSSIFLDSPAASRQGSRTPKGPSPAKRLKFTI